jgi:polo-like kinase 1
MDFVPPDAEPPSHQSHLLACPRLVTGGVIQYERIRLLGRGGFARCFAFRNLDAPYLPPVAAKVIGKQSLGQQVARKVASEIAIHRTLAHRHVVRLQHCFEDASNIYLVMDLCDGDSVYELAKRRPARRIAERDACRFVHQTALALAYLHAPACNVIHRDVKLANLFLHQGAVKLGDFGLAAKLASATERKQTVCGTPNYLAPEIIEHVGYSFEVDIWALGVCLFAMVCGVPPFETTDVATTYRRIRANDYAFDAALPISAEVKSLVRRLLDPLPSCRPTAAALGADAFLERCAAPTTPSKASASACAAAPAVPRSPLQPLAAHDVNKPATPTRRALPLLVPLPLVERFFDYSSKYGIGFALENGSFQACFNDLTRITLFGAHVLYHDGGGGAPLACTVDDYPPTLYKKVTLIKYFRDYLLEHGARLREASSGGAAIDGLVVVTRFERTGKRDAAFHLSDGSVEVHANDESLRIRIAANRRVAAVVGDADDGSSAATIDLAPHSTRFAALPPRIKRLIERHM